MIRKDLNRLAIRTDKHAFGMIKEQIKESGPKLK